MRASVLGREFALDALARLSGVAARRAARHAGRGAGRAGRRRGARRPGRLRFSHALDAGHPLRGATAGRRCGCTPGRRGARGALRRRPRAAPGRARAPLRRGRSGRRRRQGGRVRAAGRRPRGGAARLRGGGAPLPDGASRRSSSRPDDEAAAASCCSPSATPRPEAVPRRRPGDVRASGRAGPDARCGRPAGSRGPRLRRAVRLVPRGQGPAADAAARGRARRAAPGDSGLRAMLLARLAGALRDRPVPERRAALTEEAVQIARRLGDAETLA